MVETWVDVCQDTFCVLVQILSVWEKLCILSYYIQCVLHWTLVAGISKLNNLLYFLGQQQTFDYGEKKPRISLLQNFSRLELYIIQNSP